MAQTISRRKFLTYASSSVLGVGTVGIGGTAWATRVEPFALETTTTTIPLPNLPPAFDGLTIAHISDLHFGDFMTREGIAAVIEGVNALQPDVIAVTGDFVSIILDDTPALITDTLAALHAREAVVAVLGNHDHWTDAPTVAHAVRQSGARLLLNEHMLLQRNDAALYFAGVDDIWEQQHDLDTALSGIPANAPVVLLAHEPDYADEVTEMGKVGLQLSGHSHGGQVRLPFIGAPRLPWLGEKYDMGLYDVDGMALYVTRGVGMVRPHVRFNCRPEIALITLKSMVGTGTPVI
jgi:predicted MPP superfamily phosphohydrolase